MAKNYQTKRGVRAGDQYKNRHLVKRTAYRLNPAVGNGVINRRSGIEEHNSGSENGGRHDFPGNLIIAPDGYKHEHRNRCCSKIAADGMRYRTNDFFNRMVFGLFFLHWQCGCFYHICCSSDKLYYTRNIVPGNVAPEILIRLFVCRLA
ncbi:MAG: hypothetical protein FWG79_09870 [Bacteroidales bacterium]|nr:hypothetical protein [Bacteroidales bacterium]